MTKARVAPIKELTVPKLELMALLLPARMAKFIKESFEKDEFVELFVWSDSKVALSWLVSKSVLPAFVKNKKRSCVGGSLVQGREENILFNTVRDNLNDNTHLLNWERFCKVKKVYRTTAWTLRFLNNCRSSTNMKRHGELTLEELQELKNKTIAIIQREFFQEEYESLMKGVRKPQLALVHQLNLYLDNRVIRCIDYTAALRIKGKGQSPDKAYIILFKSPITERLHVEQVDNQSCDSFLMSSRKFCSRRGFPALMLSDNAITFVAASEYLKTTSENPTVKEHLLDIKCNWEFTQARALWFGAIWERLIGLLKSCLKKIVGQALLSFEELTCVLVELEGIINDRPISYMPADLNQLEIITPNHLILGRKLKSFPREVVN
ncbi:uncharacterized protein [Macrobrachium rosenbergii]|uniref:uncharacterized protein n=1 Tax=Macrobrachium rosenbergii TaxID=79674 RepID=UPI0034D40B92